MALLEKYRSRFYAHWTEHVGEEAAEAMLAQFPSRDIDEPATKEFVALQVAELRLEVVRQVDRVMARMQIIAGLGFAALAFLTVFAR